MININIIFLDVDGVLNSIAYFESLGKGIKVKHSEIDETRLLFLKQIVEKTNSNIVLSSTWRTLDDEEHTAAYAMYKYLTDTLDKYGLRIISKTPVINMDRPLEIKTWIDNRMDKAEIKFVSLDDDFSYEDYSKYGIGECLVKTTFYGSELGGLHQEHVDKAIEILNK